MNKRVGTQLKLSIPRIFNSYHLTLQQTPEEEVKFRPIPYPPSRRQRGRCMYMHGVVFIISLSLSLNLSLNLLAPTRSSGHSKKPRCSSISRRLLHNLLTHYNYAQSNYCIPEKTTPPPPPISTTSYSPVTSHSPRDPQKQVFYLRIHPASNLATPQLHRRFPPPFALRTSRPSENATTSTSTSTSTGLTFFLPSHSSLKIPHIIFRPQNSDQDRTSGGVPSFLGNLAFMHCAKRRAV